MSEKARNEIAPLLYQGLQDLAKKLAKSIENGEYAQLLNQNLILAKSKLIDLENELRTFYTKKVSDNIDYVEIWDATTLDAVNPKTRKILCGIAVFLEGVRLIDNIVIELT